MSNLILQRLPLAVRSFQAQLSQTILSKVFNEILNEDCCVTRVTSFGSCLPARTQTRPPAAEEHHWDGCAGARAIRLRSSEDLYDDIREVFTSAAPARPVPLGPK